jgi:hypothetical protein
MSSTTHPVGDEAGADRHTVFFFIDKRRYDSPTRDLTVRQLIVDFAKEDPSQVTLAVKRGDDWVELPNLDETLHVKNGEHFSIFHKTPTPVS